MLINRVASALALLAGVVALSGPARAAPVTETYTFNAGPFTGGTTSSGGTVTPLPPPVDPWKGSFTVTFDPTITVTTAGVVTSFSSNVGALGNAWDYVTFVSGGQYFLEVGNDCNLATKNCIDQTGNGFIANTGFITLGLGSAAAPTITAPTFNAAEYTTTAGSSGLVPHFSGSAGTFSVPEPGSIAVLGASLLLLGGLRMRRGQALRRTSRA